MFSNLKTGTKLACSLGLIVALLLVITVVTTIRIQAINERIVDIVDDRAVKVSLATDLEQATNVQARVLRNALIGHKDADEVRISLERIQKAADENTETLAKLEKMINAPIGQKSIQAHLDAAVAAAGPVRLMFNGVSWADTQGSSMAAMGFAAMFEPIRLAMISWYHTGPIVARHMGQHGGGAIVGITANVARCPSPSIGGFGIACAAVEHFLRQLGMEHGASGVRVCWVRSPGSPDAPGVRDVWQTHADERGISFEDLHRDYAKTTPLRRITGLAQVADAAVLLSSDLASAMTATVANATRGVQIDLFHGGGETMLTLPQIIVRPVQATSDRSERLSKTTAAQTWPRRWMWRPASLSSSPVQ
jgi:NAD(P)-dependent dehydrogenase (short-subunit alcohol dehydrogenase family)